MEIRYGLIKAEQFPALFRGLLDLRGGSRLAPAILGLIFIHSYVKRNCSSGPFRTARDFLSQKHLESFS